MILKGKKNFKSAYWNRRGYFKRKVAGLHYFYRKQKGMGLQLWK